MIVNRLASVLYPLLDMNFLVSKSNFSYIISAFSCIHLFLIDFVVFHFNIIFSIATSVDVMNK